MKFNEMNIYQIMFFRFYTVNKKHDMVKIGNRTRAKSQGLSQVHE